MEDSRALLSPAPSAAEYTRVNSKLNPHPGTSILRRSSLPYLPSICTSPAPRPRQGCQDCRGAQRCFQVFAKPPIFQLVHFASTRFDSDGMRRTELAFEFPLECFEPSAANVPDRGGVVVAPGGDNGWECCVDQQHCLPNVCALSAS